MSDSSAGTREPRAEEARRSDETQTPTEVLGHAARTRTSLVLKTFLTLVMMATTSAWSCIRWEAPDCEPADDHGNLGLGFRVRVRVGHISSIVISRNSEQKQAQDGRPDCGCETRVTRSRKIQKHMEDVPGFVQSRGGGGGSQRAVLASPTS